MKRSLSAAAAAIIIMFPGFVLLLLAIIYQPLVMAIFPPNKTYTYYAEKHLETFSWIFVAMGVLSVVGAIVIAKTAAGKVFARHKSVTGFLFALHLTIALILIADGALGSRGTVPLIPGISYHHSQFDYRLTPDSDRITFHTTVPYDFERVKSADDIRPQNGVKRVLFLGDSVVYGFHIEAEEAIPYQLQLLLGDGYEVVNAGVIGYEFAHYYYYSESLVEKLHPDIVLLGICLNDLSHTSHLRLNGDPRDEGTRTEPVTAFNKIRWWLRNNSGLLNINNGLHAQVLPENEDRMAYLVVEGLTKLLEKDKELSVRSAIADVYLGEIAGVMEKHKTPMLAIVFPFRFQYEPWADTRYSGHRDLQLTLVTLCNKHEIKVLDSFDAIKKVIDENGGDTEAAFNDYDHFNAQGAHAIAEWLAPHVLTMDGSTSVPRTLTAQTARKK